MAVGLVDRNAWIKWSRIMRIDNWGLGQMMQLPDHCFGRRFLISCSVEGGDAAAEWDISEVGFPERSVIWEVRIFSVLAGANVDSVRLALGDQLPTVTAEMDGLEPFIQGLGAQGPGPRAINVSLDGRMEWDRLRFPIATAGRKLILEVTGVAGQTPRVSCGVVVSSVPKEVPEWLFSG